MSANGFTAKFLTFYDVISSGCKNVDQGKMWSICFFAVKKKTPKLYRQIRGNISARLCARVTARKITLFLLETNEDVRNILIDIL